MGGKDHHCAPRHLVQFLDEDRAFGFERANNGNVMNDRAPNEDWRSVNGQSIPYRIDCPSDAGAETARSGKKDAERSQRLRIWMRRR